MKVPTLLIYQLRDRFYGLAQGMLFLAFFVGMIFLTGCQNSNVVETTIIDFELENIEITIGTTVRWINEDDKAHTVTQGNPPISGEWGSPFIATNDLFEYQFNRPGSFDYWCRVHPFMVGTVTVTDN
tara:strand:- start:3127 stop:3507 length:381 start_codon:yes stop_codon:yes gene_type:complete